MNPEAVDHLGLIFLTIGGLMSNWKIVVSESTVRYLKSLLFSKFTQKNPKDIKSKFNMFFTENIGN